MKVTLICTVLNEGDNIRYFVTSITKQTKKPDEFIIVDGGSKDDTYKILKEFSKKYKWIKTFQLKNANISQGRNYAIKKAKSDVIATCDGGGEYNKNWLENLTKGFNGQVSFGIDKPRARNNFQKVLAKTILHKKVVGSSRNMIFLKRIWKEVKGYPEDLLIGEDTLFDEKIKKAGYEISRVQNAVCHWEMRKDFKGFSRQFYRYGYWDGVSYRKHRMLPLKPKLLVLIIFFLIPLFPIFYLISRFSLELKIKIGKRWFYFKGFVKGFFNLKE